MFAESSEAQAALWIAIVTAVCTLIKSCFDSWLSYKLKTMVKENTAVTEQTQKDVSDTKREINGRMNQLLESTRSEAHALGVEKGRQEAAKVLVDAVKPPLK